MDRKLAEADAQFSASASRSSATSSARSTLCNERTVCSAMMWLRLTVSASACFNSWVRSCHSSKAVITTMVATAIVARIRVKRPARDSGIIFTIPAGG